MTAFTLFMLIAHVGVTPLGDFLTLDQCLAAAQIAKEQTRAQSQAYGWTVNFICAEVEGELL